MNNIANFVICIKYQIEKLNCVSERKKKRYERLNVIPEIAPYALSPIPHVDNCIPATLHYFVDYVVPTKKKKNRYRHTSFLRCNQTMVHRNWKVHLQNSLREHDYLDSQIALCVYSI